MLQVNGVEVEGVQNIRAAVFNHFSSHFRHIEVERPGVDNLSFRQLTMLESGNIIRPFTLDEVKQAIWDCNSYKSLGSDGISFSFLKQFWNVMKDDFLRFVMEFHRNGRVPKVDSPQRSNDFRPISLVGCMYKVLPTFSLIDFEQL